MGCADGGAGFGRPDQRDDAPQKQEIGLEGGKADKLCRRAVVNLEPLQAAHDAEVSRNALHMLHWGGGVGWEDTV